MVEGEFLVSKQNKGPFYQIEECSIDKGNKLGMVYFKDLDKNHRISFLTNNCLYWQK